MDLVDLVHGPEGVRLTSEFWTVAGYLDEMAKVVCPGGVVAFDIVTEKCITEEVLGESGTTFKPVPREWILAFMADRRLVYLGNHITPMGKG